MLEANAVSPKQTGLFSVESLEKRTEVAHVAKSVVDLRTERSVVQRLRRGSGEILEEIPTGTGVFACMLGGADGRTLFACLAPDFDEHARSAAREATLAAIRVDVPHAGRP